MTAFDFQQWLNAHGQSLVVDGQCGPQTRAALIAAFTNPNAAAVDAVYIAVLATRLGCQPKQIRAVTQVESNGAAYDKLGRPKMLFERHKFWQLTNGRFPLSDWNNPESGGYSLNSWNKLTFAACEDALAAFGAVSWGKFQVLGLNWHDLGYPSSLELAYSTVTGEAAHYELFARFVEHNNLLGAIRKLSTNAADNEAFARAYNGPEWRKFDYANQLAEAMA